MQGTAADTGEGAYQIEKSLRFNDAADAHLERPSITKGSTRVWTFSGWFKLTNVADSSNSTIFSAGDSPWSSNGMAIAVYTNELWVSQYDGSAYNWKLRSTRLFRDYSAWYHVCVACDTNEAISSERIKVYINGERVTQWSTEDYPSQGYETYVNNNAKPQFVGVNTSGKSIDGNMAEPQLIDGLALSPAAFGSFDSLGVWNPKAFALPTPNTNAESPTWSGMCSGTIHGGTLGYDKAFDGLSSTASHAANGNTITFTPTTNITFNTLEFIVQNGSSTSAGSLKVNGIDIWSPLGISSSNTELSVSIHKGQYGINDIDTIAWTRTADNDLVAMTRIMVDGKMLIDGTTDVTTRSNLNNNTTWSSAFVFSNGNYSNHTPDKAFNGNLTDNATSNGSNETFTWTPVGTLAYAEKVEVYNNDNVDHTYNLNGGSNIAGQGWLTLATGSGTITTINGSDSSDYCKLAAVRVDGHILIDDTVDNSFHLKFNDATKNRYLGKDTLNGKIADATGGKPIYVTSDAYGDVKGSGYTDDSSAGTTDGTGLVFAVAGDTLTDIHASINTGSSNNTINVDSGGSAVVAVVSTLDSRFYGSSIKFDGMGDCQLVTDTNADFTLGTDDFTVELWYKQLSRDTSGAGHSGGLFRISEDDFSYAWDGNFHISVSDGGALNVAYDQSKTLNGTAGDVELNKWHHIAVTKQSNLQILYIDGVERGRTTHTGIDVDEGDRIVLGNYTNHRNSVLDGYMQDVRLYRGVVKYTADFKPPTRNDFTVNNLTHTAVNLPLSTLTGGMSKVGTTSNDANWNSFDRCFDGSTSTGYSVNPATQNDYIRWTPATTRTARKVAMSTGTNSNTQGTFTVNYGSNTSVTLNIPTSVNGTQWSEKDLGSSQTINWVELKKADTTSNSAINVHAIRLDDTIVVETSLADIDSLVDSPTNYGTESDPAVGGEVRGNYCTLNPLVTAKTQSSTFSEGSLKFTGVAGGSGYPTVMGTQGQSSGKWYFEVTCTNLVGLQGVANQYHGISKSGLWDLSLTVANTYPGATADCYSIRTSNGSKTNNGSTSSYGTAYSTGDILQVAYDLDNGKIWFGQDNTWPNSGNPATGANEAYSGLSGEYFPALSCYDATVFTVNFGQRAFKYTAPSGFKSLCTQNLPNTFSGAELNNPSKYADIKTWTGTGATRDIKSFNFQPDLTWIKCTNSGGSRGHAIFDAIRGTTKLLDLGYQNNEEETRTNSLTAFISDGFTLEDYDWVNDSGDAFVSWNWDAGTAASGANNDGSINIAAGDQWVNATAGFSITKYTGNNTNSTVGHGLNAAPDFMIQKDYSDGATDWHAWHSSLSGTQGLQLSTDAAAFTQADMWNSTAPTNTVFHLGTGNDTNRSGEQIMMYCWTAIPGYSAFGTYTGNNSADGPFIYTGFRVRYLLIKNKEWQQDWLIKDTARDSDNPNTSWLRPNGSDANLDDAYIDFLSNGFRVKTTNADANQSGANREKYIYCAFAEHPFKIARAR